jgi:hypothetical protein
MAEAPVPDRPIFTATRPDGLRSRVHADVLMRASSERISNFELEPAGRFDNLICANFAEHPAFRTSGNAIHDRQNND